MKIAIVGAGIAGLSAAFDLLNAGHEVTVFEASDKTGGLASGFRDEAWGWSLERFYHHLFKSDKAIISLVDEIGFADKLFFPRPTTSVIYNGRIEPFDSPFRWFTFSGFNLLKIFPSRANSPFKPFTVCLKLSLSDSNVVLTLPSIFWLRKTLLCSNNFNRASSSKSRTSCDSFFAKVLIVSSRDSLCASE